MTGIDTAAGEGSNFLVRWVPGNPRQMAVHALVQ
jgi:hypothetical protein